MADNNKVLIYVCGFVSSLLGLAVLVGWLAGIDALVRVSPDFTAMVIGSAVCFTIAGFALVSPILFPQDLSSKFQLASGSIIATLSILFLIEHIFDVNLYIDLADLQSGISYTKPGRMAPNTATGFLLFAVALLITSFDYKERINRFLCKLVSALALLVGVIGGMGIVGYLLNLTELYEWVSFSRMAAHTAFGMVVLSIGLFKLAQYQFNRLPNPDSKGNRIVSTTVAIIVFTGASISVMSFSVLLQRTEKIIEQDFSVRAESQSVYFYQIIAHRSERAIVFSTNQLLVQIANSLSKNRHNKSALQQFNNLAARAKRNGLDTIDIEFGYNQTVKSNYLRDPASLIVNLEGKYPNQLIWNQGYLLRSHLPIVFEGKTIAYLIAEQPLDLLDNMLASAIKSGTTVDMIICAANDQFQLRCFPSRLNKEPFYLLKHMNGSDLPIVDAVEHQQSGFKKTNDYRNIPVLAAYAPIGDTGLGMVQKIDLSEIYAPIKEQFEKILIISLLLVLASYFLMRKVVQPLIKEILNAHRQAQTEQERFIAATEGGIDNFNILEAVRDAQNEIIDLRCLYMNTACSRLFNKKRGELINKLLLEEIPVNYRERFFNRYKYVIKTGEPIAEEFAIHDKDSNASWIYWQVIKLGDGIAVTSRDITEKKRLEHELIRTEKLSSAILNSTSYSIIATDEKGIIISMNKAAERMLWYNETELAGKFTPEIIHDKDEVISRAETLSAELGRDIKPGFEVFVAKTSEDISSEDEWTYVRKDGSRFPVKLSVTVLRDNEKNIYGYLGIAYDISEQKRAEEYIKHIALHDVLTGMPNRALYDDRVHVAIENAKRNDQKVGIAILDLDHFKNINDSLGHHIGDKLLQEVSKRLIHSIRPTDTVARMGGDEFAFLFSNMSYPDGAQIILNRIHQEFKTKVEINNYALHVTPSIGLAVYPDDGTDLDTLLKNADTAMYRAKELGRNGYQIFTKAMLQVASLRLSLEAELREALEKDQFELFFQPQINLQSMDIEGVEALIRWQKSPGVYCPPNEFIPLAEETGLIVPIGDWVIRTAIMQAKVFEKQFGRPIRMAVNISPRQFRQVNLVSNILDTLREFDVAPEMLEIEITENSMMADINNAVEIIEKLSAEGIKMALDDFGTGYSSLSYLSKFKFDRIKIDQSFVKNCLNHPADASLVKSIISMSKALGMAIIAEGVETGQQLDFIKSHQCDEAQGYYIGRPVPANQLNDFSFVTLQS